MSKKRIKKKKNLLPAIVITTIGMLLLISASLVLGRQNQEPGGGTPVLAVDQQAIDFGDVKFNVQKTFTIKVTNTGDGTLRFKEAPYIQVLEGC